jgi:hypothetical protein
MAGLEMKGYGKLEDVCGFERWFNELGISICAQQI